MMDEVKTPEEFRAEIVKRMEKEVEQQTFLELNSVSPMFGDTVTRNTVITAHLDYAIFNEEPSDFGYRISISFLLENGLTIAATEAAFVNFEELAGSVKIEYPVFWVWDHPIRKKPLSCYLFLTKLDSETTGQAIEQLGPFEFYEE